MSTVALGLVALRRRDRSPVVMRLRNEARLRIVFDVADWKQLPSPRELAKQPVIVVADVDGSTGVRPLLRAIRARFPAVAIVLLDRSGSRAVAQRARNLGAVAVFSRRSGPERIVNRLLSIGAEEQFDPDGGLPRLYDRLTPREWDILPYIAQRFSAKEIAEDLTLSYATVRTHLRNIYAKCGVGSRRHAAQVAEALLNDGDEGNDTIKEVSDNDELRGRYGRADP